MTKMCKECRRYRANFNAIFSLESNIFTNHKLKECLTPSYIRSGERAGEINSCIYAYA